MTTQTDIKERPSVWPDKLRLRDTGLYDDLSGLGQRIYTTAGAGYEKVEYVRADHIESLEAEVERLSKTHITDLRIIDMQQQTLLEYEAENNKLRAVVDAAKDVIECHAVTGIPQKNQSMATVSAERQDKLLRLHVALAALEDGDE